MAAILGKYCSICQKQCDTVELLIEHKSKAHEINPKKWFCYECHKESDTVPMITVSDEIQILLFPPPYSECWCKTDIEKLKKHNPFDKPNVVLCEHCHHLIAGTYYCNICNEACRDIQLLKQHMRSVHG